MKARAPVCAERHAVSARRPTLESGQAWDCRLAVLRRVKDQIMNKDQVKGSLEKAKGSVKETAGKVVGSGKMKTEGAADKAAGTVQKKAGDVKEAAKDAVKPNRKS